MRPTSSRSALVAVAAAAVAGAFAAPASAETAISLTSSVPQKVASFDTATPGTVASTTVSGVGQGERLVAIDRRPATGDVYALSTARNLYILDPATGVATRTGPRQSFGGGAFGLDFNPVVDRLRSVSTLARNFRTNVDTGATTRDSFLRFAAGDRFAGSSGRGGAAAYTNNVAGATATTLYTIDTRLNVLTTQAPPNDGTLNTVGSLGVNTTDDAAFDISGATGTAYAVLTASPGPRSRLYTIDLATGAATSVGTIGAGATYFGLTILP